MAWVNPSYVYGHAIKDAVDASDVDAITTVGTEDTDFPKDNIGDFRIGSLFKWTDSSALHSIAIDRGASPSEVDYIWFGRGGNLFVKSFNVEADTVDDFSSPTAIKGSTVIFASTTVAWGVSMTADSQQYLRINFTSTGAWEVPEIVIGKRFAPTVVPEHGYTNNPIAGHESFEKSSGAVATLMRGPQRESWSFDYRNVGATAADLTGFDALIDYTQGIVNPFLFADPFNGSANGGNLYRMTAPPVKQFDYPVPNSGGGIERYRISLEFAEYLI